MMIIRLQSEHQSAALFNLGDNCSILEKIACNPPHSSHADVHTSNTNIDTFTITHLAPSHPIILWQSPFCTCGHPTQRGPTKANQRVGRVGWGVFCFDELCKKGGKKNPNHFLSCSNLTCCDNCSVRNFFDITKKNFFFSLAKKKQGSIENQALKATNSSGCLITPCSTHWLVYHSTLSKQR